MYVKSQQSTLLPTQRYVLVVDDDRDARNILRVILQNINIEVREAAEGQEALSLIMEQRPALILLDLMMPGMDGFALLGRLQAIPRLRHIPVIVISAYAESDGDWYRLPGVLDTLCKGRYTIQELHDKVSAVLAS